MKRWIVLVIACLIPITAYAARWAREHHSHQSVSSKPCSTWTFSVDDTFVAGDEGSFIYEGTAAGVIATLDTNNYHTGQTVPTVYINDSGDDTAISSQRVYIVSHYEPNAFHATDADTVDLCVSIVEADKSSSAVTDTCQSFAYSAVDGAVNEVTFGDVDISEDQVFGIEVDNPVDNGTTNNSTLDVTVTLTACVL